MEERVYKEIMLMANWPLIGGGGGVGRKLVVNGPCPIDSQIVATQKRKYTSHTSHYTDILFFRLC